MTEREAMAILVSVREISYMQRAAALAQAGGALRLIEDPNAGRQALGEAGIGALRAAMREGDALLARLRAEHVHLIAQEDEAYPGLLARTARPPHLLFVQGRADLSDPFPIAVVGTRSADAYGVRHTRRLARELAESGVCVVSGLALGIDSAAHRGALDAGGRTVAVLGSALNRPYPAQNRRLIREIVEAGGSVISEYPPDVAAARYSFVRRNRIIAGMCYGVLVTQAPLKSGALSTVHCALEEGREVYAMPGDIDRPGSQLPHRLIAEGAAPVTDAQAIVDALVIEPKRSAQKPKRQTDAPAARPAPLAPVLDPLQRRVCELLQAGEQSFDALCAHADAAPEAISGALMLLEMDGVIQTLPGPAYRLL